MGYGLEKTPKEVMLILATNIKSIRRANNWSQKDLSIKSGVAYGSLRKFERTGIISLESLLKLSNALGRLSEFEHILEPDQSSNTQNMFDV